MKCTYYKWNNGKWFGTNFCLKEERKISQRHYWEFCSKETYNECKIYQENKNKNCLFRTILCEKMGQPMHNNPILTNLEIDLENDDNGL